MLHMFEVANRLLVYVRTADTRKVAVEQYIRRSQQTDQDTAGEKGTRSQESKRASQDQT